MERPIIVGGSSGKNGHAPITGFPSHWLRFRPAQGPGRKMHPTKRVASSFVCVWIVAIFVAGSFGGNGERFLLGQATDLENRQRQNERIRGLAASDVGDAPLRCSDSTTGTGIYMGHVSGVEGEGAFDDVEVLLTCGSRALERTVPGPDGGFVFEGLPDGDYVVTVRKTGYRGPPARRFRLEGGVITSPPPGAINREYVLAPLDPDTFVYHWEEDQSTAGYDYSAHVNQPLEVEFLDESVEVSDSSSAVRLNRDYKILLVDSAGGTWTKEHAYRLLETIRTIPQEDRLYPERKDRGASKWLLTSNHVLNDIRITGGNVVSERTVLISEEAFVNASPRIALIEGKRGRYYSQRLHHALVRFVTDNGRHEASYEKILQERFGVTTRITEHTTYEALTASTTGEGASRFQKFHSEEIVQLINTLEEMPGGMHKIPELKYLVRRLDGTPHPLYSEAPAVAWPDSGYIEFMDTAFLQASISAVHRLILHEKAHFLWAHLFDDRLKADWIELGGWYEDVRSPSRWSTTKQTEFVSAYGHLKNPNEDMAESIAFFVINPDKLKSRAIGKYEFVRDRIMQGSFYISRIREDLTFEVYNLYPDYVFPGKIRRVDIRVTGAAEEDKTVRIEVELHALDKVLEGAEKVSMRVVSEIDTYEDVFLYPEGDARTGTVLSGGFTLSKFAKAGYWFPTQIRIWDAVGNERFERGDDFGWSLYVNNPREDVTPPQYVRNSASLTKSVETREGQEIQVIRASWQVDENNGLIENNPCYASINDELLETYRFEEHGDYDSQSERCEVLFLMPHYMPSSVYTMNYIRMTDLALNTTGVFFGDPGHLLRPEQSFIDETAQQIELVTNNPDTEAPEVDLNAIQVSAKPTNPEAPNGETLVTLTFRIRDNISGFTHAWLNLRDPQGIEHEYFGPDPNRDKLFPSGDPSQWTTYTWTVVLPPGSAPGTWGLAEMTVWDRAENFQQYDFTEIIHFDVESD